MFPTFFEDLFFLGGGGARDFFWKHISSSSIEYLELPYLMLEIVHSFKPEIRHYPHFIEEEREDQRDCDISLSHSVCR